MILENKSQRRTLNVVEKCESCKQAQTNYQTLDSRRACGFCPSCETVDQIFTLAGPLRRPWELGCLVCMCMYAVEMQDVCKGYPVWFTVQVSLCQGCPWSLILSVLFLDWRSRHAHGKEEVQFEDPRSYLSFLQIRWLCQFIQSMTFDVQWNYQQPGRNLAPLKPRSRLAKRR